MKNADVVTILEYYGDIPELLHMVNRALRELDEDYNSLHGVAMDGMPHGTTPGHVTESLAERLADDRERRRSVAELRSRKRNYLHDSAAIHEQLLSLGLVAMQLLREKYVIGQTWERAVVSTNWSVSTKKRKADFALRLLGAKLDRLPDADALLARARNARAI